MAKKPKSAEINPGPGFRVRMSIERTPKALVERYRKYETPDISDMLNRLYTMTSEIRNFVNETPLIGPACTVKVYPGDNLMIHKALDVAKPGDVIVVDTGGNRRNAVIGDLVSNKAKHRGIAGFVIDGLIRDLPGVVEADIPVFSRGITPIGPLHRGPGELNYSISCGGIVVNPGDLIVADTIGVVVVRKDFAESIVDRLDKSRENLSRYIADVKKGIFSNEWVDEQLQKDNCHFDD